MRRFIKRVLWFAALIFVLSLLLDLIISGGVKNIRHYPGEHEVWNDIFSSEINAEVAIYGSSRAWVHVSPDLIYKATNLKAYNFGADGQNFNIQYLRHLKYLELNTPPKLIILSLDIFSLAKAKNLYGLEQFLPYMLWDKDIFDFTNAYNGFNTIDYILPLARYGGKPNLWSKLIHNNKNKIRNDGYLGVEEEWNNDFEDANEKFSHYEIEINDKLIGLLEQFILEIKEKRISLVFIYTPEFVEGQDFVKNRANIIDIYNKLAYKHRIPFYNYSNCYLNHQKEMFYNASHLNKEGSEQFTRILISDMEKQFTDIKK